METFLITIFIIGIISALFGILLIFAPNVILKFEEKANILYMTDTAFLKNRIPLGVAMLGISGFLSYTYSVTAINEIIFLLIAVVAGIFGILLFLFFNSPQAMLMIFIIVFSLFLFNKFYLKERLTFFS